ncbi:MAG: ribonuclease III [Deltaproteobacteria bacterium]|nr:ribonuclease III [Deltaproteobacteria bacterium]
MTDPLHARLQSALGYDFNDEIALRAALTHRSWTSEHSIPREQRERFGMDNERLEFLGDSVLGMVVSESLWQRVPNAPEGVLSRLRAAVVNESSLARAASKVDLGEAMRLGRGEDRSGGRARASLLADALEAVFAAVFLDGGIDSARVVILKLLAERIEEVTRVGTDDPKSVLQELLQAEYKITPKYRIIATYGPDHDREHEVAIDAGDVVTAQGRGRSKKDAEQAAARAALERLRLGPEPSLPEEQTPADSDEALS